MRCGGGWVRALPVSVHYSCYRWEKKYWIRYGLAKKLLLSAVFPLLDPVDHAVLDGNKESSKDFARRGNIGFPNRVAAINHFSEQHPVAPKSSALCAVFIFSNHCLAQLFRSFAWCAASWVCRRNPLVSATWCRTA